MWISLITIYFMLKIKPTLEIKLWRSLELFTPLNSTNLNIGLLQFYILLYFFLNRKKLKGRNCSDLWIKHICQQLLHKSVGGNDYGILSDSSGVLETVLLHPHLHVDVSSPLLQEQQQHVITHDPRCFCRCKRANFLLVFENECSRLCSNIRLV